MPAPYQRHLFVCTNRRPDGHPKGSCAEKGSEQLRERFKQALANRGLAKQMRANAAGCLDQCEHGCSVVVYPEGVWYGRVQLSDVDEIVEEHLVHGRIVERLLMPFMKPNGRDASDENAGGAQAVEGARQPGSGPV
jgi:(2Fe-2S) ferredoxin